MFDYLLGRLTNASQATLAAISAARITQTIKWISMLPAVLQESIVKWARKWPLARKKYRAKSKCRES
jgi:hypothetical protein